MLQAALSGHARAVSANLDPEALVQLVKSDSSPRRSAVAYGALASRGHVYFTKKVGRMATRTGHSASLRGLRALGLRTAAVSTLAVSILLLSSGAAPSPADASTATVPKTLHIFWTDYGVAGSGTTLGEATIGGKIVNPKLITGAHGPVGVAIHGGYIYWSNPSSQATCPGTSIGRALINGKSADQNFITGTGCGHSIVVAGSYIYWASRGGNTIGRARLNGTQVDEHFIRGAQGPWGIAVSGNYIYWTNYGAQLGDLGTTIGRANLNGTGVNQSFITGAAAPAGLGVSGSYIYWSNQGVGFSGRTLGRAKINGTDVNQSYITGLTMSPAGLNVFGKYIYFTSFASSEGGTAPISRVGVNGTGLIRRFIPGLNTPIGIAVALTN
jgi:virginiamycin B lyase